MKAYSFEMSMSPEDITYAVMEYGYFVVREVMIGDKPKGEYHIKILDRSNLRKAVEFFQRELPGIEVGMVDPSGELNLEYPIYAIAEGEMEQAGMMSSFEQIDATLNKHYGNRTHEQEGGNA